MSSSTRYLILIATVAAALSAQEPASRPAEVYTTIAVTEAERLEGNWPEGSWSWFRRGNVAPFSVVVDGGEGFLFLDPDTLRPGGEVLLVLRSAPGRDLTATVMLPNGQEPSLATRVKCRIPKERLGNATREDFARAARDWYRALAGGGLPGAAWFRNRADFYQAELARAPDSRDSRNRLPIEEWARRNNVGGDDLSETYDFFSAGRAVSENLRLDRELVPIDGGEPTIPIGSIGGITTKAFDWKAAAAGLTPKKDPLASKIPEDQHAAFFPNVDALTAVLDAIDADAPMLQAGADRSEDLGVRAFYEGQLGLSTKEPGGEWGKAIASALFRSVAITGSDPYFRTGTDVAVLFESPMPDALLALIAARHATIRKERPDVGAIAGDLGGIPYQGISTPDHTISSYAAALDGAVVVANSIFELEKIARLAKSKEPASLAESPEYVFFRNRYPRGDAAETAFVILTDATIRRWCGPQWRIADARRTRAAARLSDLTASFAQELVADRRDLVPAAPGLGNVKVTPAGFDSDVYGNLRFLRPIVEMDVSRVTKAEAAAYERFRDTYQQRWMTYFDPIAVRLELSPTRTGVDATVMPLVASSDYRWIMDLARSARFGPAACDPHANAAVQFVFAVDASASVMQPWERRAHSLVPNLEGLALSWLKGGVSVSLDQDPILHKLAKESIFHISSDELAKLPVLLTAEVKNPVMLALFLAGIRSTMDEAGLGSVKWTKGRYRDLDTMTVAGLDWSGPDPEKAISIRYAITGGLLLVALREDVLNHALDRVLDRKAGKAVDAPPWLGESAALRVDGAFAREVAGWAADDIASFERTRAYEALPILNEWYRLFPDKDPVLVHEKLFKARLLDPAGGRYVVDQAKKLVVSETYGHPTETRPAPKIPRILEGLTEGRGGLTFDNDGVRGRLVIEREKK